MRLLHISAADLWAGAETMLYNLVKAQQRCPELEVAVVLFNEGRLAEGLNELGVETVVFPEARFGVVQLVRRCRDFMRAFRPDVVHTHKFKEDLVGAIAAATSPSRPVCVRTVHGMDEASAKGLGGGAKLRLSRAVHGLCVRRRFAMTFAVSRVLQHTLQNAAKLDRVACIANGIDMDGALAWPSLEHASDSTPVRIGFAGRLVPVKRVDMFLQMAAILEKEAPGQFAFYVHGEGPEQERLLELTRRLGLEERVRFCGFSAAMLAELQLLDLLYLTSDSEGLPMVALEAMAVGVPVVAHAVGELPSLLDHGRSGTLVETHQAASYAAVAMRYLEHRAEFRERARQARIRVEETYSATATARAYLDAYRRCLMVHRRAAQ